MFIFFYLSYVLIEILIIELPIPSPGFLIFPSSTFEKSSKKVSEISNYMKVRIMQRLLHSGVIYLAWRS